MHLLLYALILILATASSSVSPCIEPYAQGFRSGRCYYVTERAMSFRECETLCVDKYSGTLPRIRNKQEDLDLEDIARNSNASKWGGVWIGFTDAGELWEDKWRWTRANEIGEGNSSHFCGQES